MTSLRPARTASTPPRRSRRAALGLAVLTFAGCNELWGISARELDPHLVCDGGDCVCAAAYGDCDSNPDNGCEASFQAAATCGGCGRRCEKGACIEGACICNEGFTDCDGDAANGCEAAPASDGANCGACGHDCLGGACVEGRCDPVELASREGSTGFEAFLVLHDGWLYAGGCDVPQIEKVPVTGGVPAPAAHGAECAYSAAIAAGALYWASDTRVVKTPLDDPATSEILRDGLAFTGQVAAGGGRLLWVEADPALDSTLKRAALPFGSAVEDLWSVSIPSYISPLIADEANAYFTDHAGIYAVPHASTAVVEVVDIPAERFEGNTITGMAVGGGYLYWADFPYDTITRIPLAGGEPTHVADADFPGPLAVDAKFVYWADTGGKALRRAPNDGSGASVALVIGAEEILALAVDDRAVYWVTESRLMKLAK